jgi:hypothetical protein
LIYRKLTSTGDYTFGKGAANFLVGTPDTVAQAVKTRLALITGEWFLDLTRGTPYKEQILAEGKMALYDHAIKEVILNTQGVRSILEYASGVNPNTRAAFIACTIDTIYGQTLIQHIL